ncbi:MAG: L-rhamnose mutarotase [Phycisphaera sp. TMED9]|nr:MAG: L-rhamnose mutarotase [Phycisphaera sp. TMED9]
MSGQPPGPTQDPIPSIRSSRDAPSDPSAPSTTVLTTGWPYPARIGTQEHHLKTFAQALDLIDDPDRIAEYDRYHVEAWPEVVRGLRSLGIQRMLLWRTGRRLFMTFDAPEDFDPVSDYQTYAEDPRCREWDELMKSYQQRIPNASGPDGAWWTPMDLVFDLEAQPS